MLIRFHVGMGEDYQGRKLLSTDTRPWIYETLTDLASEFGGAFLIQGTGSWYDGKRVIVEEGGVFQVIAEPYVSQIAIVKAAVRMRDRFRQTTVIVTIDGKRKFDIPSRDEPPTIPVGDGRTQTESRTGPANRRVSGYNDPLYVPARRMDHGRRKRDPSVSTD